jgi:hypothetical protein
VSVADGSGRVVRHLESGVSHNGQTFSYCYYGYTSVSSWGWDGRDDAGAVVPDGGYTVTVAAVDADGATANVSTTRTVDTRIPGRLTAPTPGSVLSGTATAVFTLSFPRCGGQVRLGDHAAVAAGLWAAS